MMDKMLFFEPRQKLQELICFPEGEPEMTEFESAFLCGLIKKCSPHKIIEVGIAAGGTTAIILSCLKQLGMNLSTELHSVDISEKFYRGKGEKSGYLAEIAKKKLQSEFHHTYHLGNVLPTFLDEIGNNIDFAILDTTHSMPGEILEFITLYPYLSPNACIVLHDIANNHYGSSTSAFATQVLLDSVTATKIVEQDDSRESQYPNIGAFVLNEDTSKYIKDVFNSLMISWNYIPHNDVFLKYTDNICRNYRIEFQQIITTIYQLQLKTWEKQQITENTTFENLSWRKSNSYKIGRFITYIPRKIKKIIQRFQ